MRKIPVASHLSDGEYILLLTIYADHNSSMGMKERNKYTLTNIVKVESSPEEECIKVYYENGDWWHYNYNGTWY